MWLSLNSGCVTWGHINDAGRMRMHRWMQEQKPGKSQSIGFDSSSFLCPLPTFPSFIHLLACEPHGPIQTEKHGRARQPLPLSSQLYASSPACAACPQVTHAPPTPIATLHLPVHPACHTVTLPLPQSHSIALNVLVVPASSLTYKSALSCRTLYLRRHALCAHAMHTPACPGGRLVEHAASPAWPVLASLKCAAPVAPCCTTTPITHGHTRVRSLWGVRAAAPPAHAWLWPQEGQAAGPVARFSLPAGPIGACGVFQARKCPQQGQGKGPAVESGRLLLSEPKERDTEASSSKSRRVVDDLTCGFAALQVPRWPWWVRRLSTRPARWSG
jgi:hypothetical protein